MTFLVGLIALSCSLIIMMVAGFFVTAMIEKFYMKRETWLESFEWAVLEWRRHPFRDTFLNTGLGFVAIVALGFLYDFIHFVGEKIIQ